MSAPATDKIVALVTRQMATWKTTKRTEATCQAEVTALSDALIAYFAEFYRKTDGLRPTTNNVSAIVIEEMMKWTPFNADLEALADRLIRYMAIYHAEPVQLDGLPGGHAFDPASLSLGRRTTNKRALMNGSSGIVLPK